MLRDQLIEMIKKITSAPKPIGLAPINMGAI
jgi:hypothetical protein